MNVTVYPEVPYIEKEQIGQYINFDFALENTSNEPIRIIRIEVTVLDSADKLILRKFLDGNGSAPNIKTLSVQSLETGQTQLLFNPFHTFDPDIKIAKLRYALEIEGETSQANSKYEISVAPVVYETKTPLILPLKGPFIVYDGHEFLSHHRRFDYVHPVAKQFGIDSNFMRYAYDFCPVDEAGAMFQGDEAINEHWHGFGTPIYATGTGRVVGIFNEMLDNRSFDEDSLAKDLRILFGNQIVIDHLNGEYSMFAHLKQNSIKVKVGDHVEQDQLIAEIGASGTANIPHLHYELRNSPAMQGVEGIPSYFHHFRRRLGSTSVLVEKGIVDTGDIVER